MSKDKSLRIHLSRAELINFHSILGGKIGALQSEASMKDLKPSEYRPQIEYWALTMRRIEDLLGKKEPAE